MAISHVLSVITYVFVYIYPNVGTLLPNDAWVAESINYVRVMRSKKSRPDIRFCIQKVDRFVWTDRRRNYDPASGRIPNTAAYEGRVPHSTNHPHFQKGIIAS